MVKMCEPSSPVIQAGTTPVLEDSLASKQPGDQYHHYIPRCILRNFASSEGGQDGKRVKILHNTGVTEEKPLRSVCGEINLYKLPISQNNGDPLQVEKLFSDLERDAGQIFKIIKDTCAKVDMYEDEGLKEDITLAVELTDKEIGTLRKFVYLSETRNKYLGEQYRSKTRINNHILGPFIDARMKEDGVSTPEMCWLGRLRYFLETSHVDLLQAATQLGSDDEDMYRDLHTYKCNTDAYALFIWKAPRQKEFLIADNMIGFEGLRFVELGFNTVRPEMVVQSTEMRHHIFLPISPVVTLVLCHRSICCGSPSITQYEDYQSRSMIAEAMHGEPKTITIPSRGKPGSKSYRPPITKRAFPITTLTPGHYRALNSYTLYHARGYVIYKSEQFFKESLQDLGKFFGERKEHLLKSISASDATLSSFHLTHSIDSTQYTACSQTIRIKSSIMKTYYNKHRHSRPQGKHYVNDSDQAALLNLFVKSFPPLPSDHRHAHGICSLGFLQWLTNDQFLSLVEKTKLKLMEVMESELNLYHIPRDLINDDIAVGIIEWLWDERQDILHGLYSKVMIPKGGISTTVALYPAMGDESEQRSICEHPLCQQLYS